MRANGDEGTPVPIPNTVVKLVNGDNTWLATARKDNKARTQKQNRNGSAFLLSECKADFYMIPIVCVDERNGMLFSGRRQSQDRIVREDILKEIQGHTLWMNAYSAKQFSHSDCPNLLIAEDFLQQAGEQDFCFVENQCLTPYLDHISTLFVYRWDRRYPADFYLDIPLDTFILQSTADFSGYSHKKIQKERYRR